MEQQFDPTIMERVQTFEAVCREMGKNPADYAVPEDATDDDKADMEEKKMKLVIKCFKQGWKADYNDPNQIKYEPILRYVPGSGFVLYGVDCANSFTYVGARHVLPTRELVIHVCKYFMHIYNGYMNHN